MVWKSVWKRDRGNEMLFWHPSGSPQGTYYFGTKLVDAKNPEWDSTLPWVHAMDEWFSNVYVPWSSHEPSQWRVCHFTVVLGESLRDQQSVEMAELKLDNQSKTDEIQVLKKELEIAKQQLDVAAGMSQQEWQPEATPASTTSAWMAPTPKMPATGSPSSMSSVAWLLCFSYSSKLHYVFN